MKSRFTVGKGLPKVDAAKKSLAEQADSEASSNWDQRYAEE